MLFLKGMILGFSIAAPLGPIGLLCIRRTLHTGFWAGVLSGLGTALADMLYATIAVFGISAISDWLIAMDRPIRLVGGLLMFALAWRMYHSHQNPPETNLDGRGAANYFLTTFFLTITNPGTVVLFAAVFLALGFTSAATHAEACVIVAGVFAGSMAWWTTLSAGVHFFKPQSVAENMHWLNRIAALLLAGCGTLAVGSVVWDWLTVSPAG